MTWYSFKVISTCTHICIHSHMQRPGKIMTKNDDGDNSRVVELDVHFFFNLYFQNVLQCSCVTGLLWQHQLPTQRRSVIRFASVQNGLCFFFNRKGPEIRHLWETSLPLFPQKPIWACASLKIHGAFEWDDTIHNQKREWNALLSKFLHPQM